MGKKFFYGRCKVRPNVKVDLTTGDATIVVSTQVRPSGTKVEDPEEGTLGNNSAEHNPPTHVTLYLCPGGTGEGDDADPLTTWNLVETAQALEDGRLQAICNGYLAKEWSVRKSDSEGGESIERRFAVDVRLQFDKSLHEQGFGLILRNHASLTLAVLETQPEFDDMPEPNPKPKRKKKADDNQGKLLIDILGNDVQDHAEFGTPAILSLGPDGLAIEFPDHEPQEPGDKQPLWDFSTFSTAKLLRVLSRWHAWPPDYLAAVQAELDSRPVETPDAAQELLDSVADLPDDDTVLPEQAESMIDRANKARRRK